VFSKKKIADTKEAETGGSRFEASLSKSERPYLKKITKSKWTGGVVEVVEYLPSSRL
jgi:hypothetical protein